MRRASPASFVALAALLLVACSDLPSVQPGPRWIDQFSEVGGYLAPPTWSAFGPWSCGSSGTGDQDAGAPGGADAGGQRPACLAGPGDTDDTDDTGLEAPFDLQDQQNDIDFTVETDAAMGPVDFTGFRQFVFHAELKSASSGTQPLPSGTELTIELLCSKNVGDSIATQPASDVKVDAQKWSYPHLDLSQFELVHTSRNQGCLSRVDGIRFVVQPGSNAEPSVAGTLSLDDISLQD